jgi:hypothetical protein
MLPPSLYLQKDTRTHHVRRKLFSPGSVSYIFHCWAPLTCSSASQLEELAIHCSQLGELWMSVLTCERSCNIFGRALIIVDMCNGPDLRTLCDQSKERIPCMHFTLQVPMYTTCTFKASLRMNNDNHSCLLEIILSRSMHFQ